jgi:hypothetical protein
MTNIRSSKLENNGIPPCFICYENSCFEFVVFFLSVPSLPLIFRLLLVRWCLSYIQFLADVSKRYYCIEGKRKSEMKRVWIGNCPKVALVSGMRNVSKSPCFSEHSRNLFLLFISVMYTLPSLPVSPLCSVLNSCVRIFCCSHWPHNVLEKQHLFLPSFTIRCSVICSRK